jgi:hypothetical protein
MMKGWTDKEQIRKTREECENVKAFFSKNHILGGKDK